MYLCYVGWFHYCDLKFNIWSPALLSRSRPGWALEDAGCGPTEIYFGAPNTVESLGCNRELFASSGIKMMTGGSALSKGVDAPWDDAPIPSVVCHFVREADYGIELRSRFWVGYTSFGNGLVFLPDSAKQIDEKMVCGLARHCMTEFAHLRSVLPKLYRFMSDSKS